MTYFDFVLYHKPGKMMQMEDPLSRRVDYEMGIDLDNTNQVLLKSEFFAINAYESPINDEIILKEVKAALLSDEVTKDYKLLLKSGPREFEKSLQDWNYENGLLLYRGKIYIPHSVEDLWVGLQKLLVAWNNYICQEICYRLWNVSANKKLPIATFWTTQA